MAKMLNQKVAESAKAQESPYSIQDPTLSGFALRVQPTGRKSWTLRYIKPDTQKRTTRTLGKFPVQTYGMALDKAKAILRGEDPDAEDEDQSKQMPLTFGDFIKDYYEKYIRQHHSRPEETLKYIERFKLGSKPIADIRLADGENIRLEMKSEGRTHSTINRQTTAIKAALQKAADWELIESNPFAKLKLLKVDKNPVVRYLDHNEMKRLKDALIARDDKKRQGRINHNEWLKARRRPELPLIGEYCDNITPLILLALNTGLRRGELLNLVWGDIDLKKSLLTVHGKGAKSGQTRHIPLNAQALDVLKKHKGKVLPIPSKPVFGQHKFQKSFAGVLEKAKIKKFRFHDLRHTFASHLVIAGVPLNTVRELLGHSDMKITLRYAHLAPDNLRQAVELL